MPGSISCKISSKKKYRMRASNTFEIIGHAATKNHVEKKVKKMLSETRRKKIVVDKHGMKTGTNLVGDKIKYCGYHNPLVYQLDKNKKLHSRMLKKVKR